MADLPPVSNVFGYVHSALGLAPVAEQLRSRLDMSADEVCVTRNASDGHQTLRIETVTCSLETRPARRADTWQLNGAVAGTPDEILATLLPITRVLKWAGLSAVFEIYDDQFRFVGRCPPDDEAL